MIALAQMFTNVDDIEGHAFNLVRKGWKLVQIGGCFTTDFSVPSELIDI